MCMDSRHVHASAPAMCHVTPLFLNHLRPLPLDDGDYVTLVPNYKQFDDAGRGPLSLQRIDNAFGMIIITSGNRFRVRQTGHINSHPHIAAEIMSAAFVRMCARSAAFLQQLGCSPKPAGTDFRVTGLSKPDNVQHLTLHLHSCWVAVWMSTCTAHWMCACVLSHTAHTD